MTTPVRYRLSDLVFESACPLPELMPLSEDDTARPEVRVSWHDARSSPLNGAQFSAWLTAEGPEWLTFADAAGGFLLTFPGHGQFEIAHDASVVGVHPFSQTPPDTMRHLLLNQILPLVLSRRGRLVMHASAVSYRDRVVAFVGRSGGGKSTLAMACARAGAAIVSDDCLVVNRTASGWSTVPCHAGVRLWPAALALFGWHAEAGEPAAHYSDKRRFDEGHHGLAFETRNLPLAAILYLPPLSAGESPTSALGPGALAQTLRGRDAVMALASEFFRLDSRDASESRRQFDAISRMAAEIPVEIPERQPPDAAARSLLCRITESWRRPRD